MEQHDSAEISKQEKLDFILKMIKDHSITNYELEKNTGVSQAGLGSIVKGETKNPRLTTINVLFDYIKMKYDFEVETKSLESSSNDIVKIDNFSKISIEKKLEILYEQNLNLQRENQNLRQLIMKQGDVNQNSRNTIVEYIDLYLKPVFDYIQVENKERENN